MMGRYKVVTLCGSSKFKEDFIEQQRLLTLQGYIVITPGNFSHFGDFVTKEQKDMLHDMHKKKIDMADEIYVINKNGYIGNSTMSEIEYAESKGKPIKYMEYCNNGTLQNEYINTDTTHEEMELIIDFLGTWNILSLMPCIVYRYLGNGETIVVSVPICLEELEEYLNRNLDKICVVWTTNNFTNTGIVNILNKLRIKWSTNIKADEYKFLNVSKRYINYWIECRPDRSTPLLSGSKMKIQKK